MWRTLLSFLVQGKRLDRSLVSLDGTHIPSQEFTEQTGYSGKHRLVGTNLSLLDRANGPAAKYTEYAHEPGHSPTSRRTVAQRIGLPRCVQGFPNATPLYVQPQLVTVCWIGPLISSVANR